MADCTAINLAEHEYAECTPNLRWIVRYVPFMDGHTAHGERVLQQAWRITVRSSEGVAMGSRLEWVDVPETRETR